MRTNCFLRLKIKNLNFLLKIPNSSLEPTLPDWSLNFMINPHEIKLESKYNFLIYILFIFTHKN